MIIRNILLVMGRKSQPANIVEQLDRSGYRVTCQPTIAAGWQAVQASQTRNKPFAFCIVDADLHNNEDALKFMRMLGFVTPLTVKTLINYRRQPVTALEAGAEIIIDPPFNIEELLHRMRRFENYLSGLQKKDVWEENQEEETLTIGQLQFRECVLYQNGLVVQRLTPKQGQLLAFLSRNANRLIQRGELWRSVWGLDVDELSGEFESRSMDVLICALRKHLGADPSIELQTHANIGFCLTVNSKHYSYVSSL